MRRAGPGLITVAPALFVSVVISAGILVFFLADLFVALGLPAGTSGRQRLLQFLAPADLASAIAIVLAVALVVLQRQLPGEAAAVVGPRGGRVRSIALLAGAVAAVIAVAALIRAIASLTIPHQNVMGGFGLFLASLVTMAVAGAAAVWGLRDRW